MTCGGGVVEHRLLTSKVQVVGLMPSSKIIHVLHEVIEINKGQSNIERRLLGVENDCTYEYL